MDPEDKKLLKDTLTLVEENNSMLRKVRKVQKRQYFFAVVHWIVIIGVAIGAFYFIQPYINKAKTFFGDVGSAIDKFKNATVK